MKVCWEMGSLHSPQLPPHKLLINFKEKNSNLIVEKPGRDHEKQVITVMSLPLVRLNILYTSDIIHWEGHITSVVLLPKIHNLNYHEKTLNKYNWKKHWKTTGRSFLKVSRSWKTKNNWEIVTDYRKCSVGAWTKKEVFVEKLVKY